MIDSPAWAHAVVKQNGRGNDDADQPGATRPVERDGFLVPPGLFSPDEVAATKQDFGRIQQVDTDHLVREKTGRVARTSFRMAPARQPMAAEWAFPEILAGR